MEVNSLTNDTTEDSGLNNTEDTEIADAPETKQNTPKPVSHLTPRKQPEVLCNCPSYCDKKIDKEWRMKIYRQFHDTCDHAFQNQFIQRHIKIKSIAHRLWEEEVPEKKIQRRVTCKYLIPLNGSVRESYHYAKSFTYYDVAGQSSETSLTSQNGCNFDNSKDLREVMKTNSCAVNGHDSLNNDSAINELATNLSIPKMNGDLHDVSMDKLVDSMLKENIADVNSPSSFNDNESVNTVLNDENSSESDTSTSNPTSVKYVDVCQKAFMNMYGITEKRIRWQREKLIIMSRFIAEKERKELEEMDRTLSLARSLGAGCQPLFAMLEKSNCTHLSEQLVGAIEDDVALVNNFFHNQLWKPEDIMKKSSNFAKLDSLETECD